MGEEFQKKQAIKAETKEANLIAEYDIANLLSEAFKHVQYKDPYMKLGSSQDVSQINPYTQQMWSKLMDGGAQGGGLFNQAMSAAFGGEGSQTRMYEDAVQALLTGDRSDPFASTAFGAADIAGENTLRDISKMYGAGNMLYSGPFQETAGRGVASARHEAVLPYLQSLGGLAQGAQQSGMGMLSNILGTASPMAQQQYYTPSWVGDPTFTSPLDMYGLSQGVQMSTRANLMGGLSGGISSIASLAGVGTSLAGIGK